MTYCSAIYASCVQLEAMALEDDFYEEVVADMLWPEQVFSREVLVGIDEMDGTGVPDVIDNDLDLIAPLPKTSAHAENTFNALRNAQQDHTAGLQHGNY